MKEIAARGLSRTRPRYALALILMVLKVQVQTQQNAAFAETSGAAPGRMLKREMSEK